MNVELAPDIQSRLRSIVETIPLTYIDSGRITCVRSRDTKTRARARIWSFPSIWQFALKMKPRYVIEVVSQHFDHLTTDDKTRVIIHELMHIPKTFSGALVPHRSRHHRIDRRSVEKMFTIYKNSVNL